MFVADLLPEIANRKSPRAFQTRPVEEEKIQLLLRAFQWAPSSYNKQPWRIVIAVDPAVLTRMHEGIMTGNRRWAVKAPVLAVIVSKLEADDVRHDNAIPYYLYDCHLWIPPSHTTRNGGAHTTFGTIHGQPIFTRCGCVYG